MLEMYKDADGREIEIGMIVAESKIITSNRPFPVYHLAVVVGRHDDENLIFVRFMGQQMVHQFHPAKLLIATGRVTSLAA